jgi:predicted amidophosphoribosyltransferase
MALLTPPGPGIERANEKGKWTCPSHPDQVPQTKHKQKKNETFQRNIGNAFENKKKIEIHSVPCHWLLIAH